jgi:hypothetical protein
MPSFYMILIWFGGLKIFLHNVLALEAGPTPSRQVGEGDATGTTRSVHGRKLLD